MIRQLILPLTLLGFTACEVSRGEPIGVIVLPALEAQDLVSSTFTPTPSGSGMCMNEETSEFFGDLARAE